MVGPRAALKRVAMIDVSAYGKLAREAHGGVYQDAAIPAGTYPRVDSPVPTISIPNYIVVKPEG